MEKNKYCELRNKNENIKFKTEEKLKADLWINI